MWTSYNSPKGRMLALPLLVRSGDAIDLWMPAPLLPAVQKRLRMFVLRSKVVLEDLGAARVAIALEGPSAEASLRAAGFAVPSAPRDAVEADDAVAVRAFGAEPRFLVLCAPGRLPVPADDAARRLGDIRAGVAAIYPETQERWVAQMANLDLLGGIGFEKGCYTGQEVVARLHYLGNLKRRMLRLDGEGPPPAPGTAIHESGGDGQSVGEIVDAVADGQGRFAASAVLQLSHAASSTLVAGTARCGVPAEYRYPG